MVKKLLSGGVPYFESNSFVTGQKALQLQEKYERFKVLFGYFFFQEKVSQA